MKPRIETPACMPHFNTGNEQTLCGFAYDVHKTGDSETPVRIGEPGEHVTCEQCLEALAYYKSVKRNRIP